jgi:hypothetical protein
MIIFCRSPYSARWWASWFILSSLSPIVWLYGYYIPVNYCMKSKVTRQNNLSQEVSAETIDNLEADFNDFESKSLIATNN